MSDEKKQQKKLSFEEDLKRLEEIVATLEQGEAPLDKSLALFEEGQVVLKRCRKVLADAQVRVEKLLDNGERQPIDPEQIGRS